MKRLTIAAASLLLLAACGHSPTGSDEGYTSDPSGSLILKIGPEVGAILEAGSAPEVPALVANAWAEQQSCDLYKEVTEAAALIMAENPALVEITQSRLAPVILTAGKSIPTSIEYPEFGPLLQEVLAKKGLVFRLHESEIPLECYVPMATDGDNIDMRLTVTEVILSHATWH